MAIEQICENNKVLALVIKQKSIEDGVKFFTPDEYSLQAGQHKYPRGKIIKPHVHCPVKQDRFASLQEVLYIQKGRVKVSFYAEDGRNIDAKILQAGDILLLMEGGHGFEFLEPTEMLEIKQGPYNPESKKPLTVKE